MGFLSISDNAVKTWSCLILSQIIGPPSPGLSSLSVALQVLSQRPLPALLHQKCQKVNPESSMCKAYAPPVSYGFFPQKYHCSLTGLQKRSSASQSQGNPKTRQGAALQSLIPSPACTRVSLACHAGSCCHGTTLKGLGF